MKKTIKEHASNILVEKQKFYISEFEQECTWLSFMHKEGWKLLSTDGFHYRFEKTEKEDWCYQLDYKENGIPEDDYLQMYQDFGWEYVGQFNHWCYFRKKHTTETDSSLFSDRETKLEFCKRILHGQFLRLLPLFLLYGSYLTAIFFTDLFPKKGFLGGLFDGLAFAIAIVFLFLLTNYFSQMHLIRKMMKRLGHTN